MITKTKIRDGSNYDDLIYDVASRILNEYGEDFKYFYEEESPTADDVACWIEDNNYDVEHLSRDEGWIIVRNKYEEAPDAVGDYTWEKLLKKFNHDVTKKVLKLYKNK